MLVRFDPKSILLVRFDPKSILKVRFVLKASSFVVLVLATHRFCENVLKMERKSNSNVIEMAEFAFEVLDDESNLVSYVLAALLVIEGEFLFLHLRCWIESAVVLVEEVAEKHSLLVVENTYGMLMLLCIFCWSVCLWNLLLNSAMLMFYAFLLC